MSYRILTKNGVDNTNIDAARAEFFNSGMRDGIVRGAFTEGTFSSNASNSVYLDSCELRISGHRVVIDEPVYKTFSNTPSSNTRYSFVAQISVDSVSVVAFSIIIQDANTELRKDNLYATETGTGIYQIEIGRFTLTTTGTIIDIVRTADLITGGGEDENTYIEIGEVTTTTLNEGIDAEVDVENVIDEQTGKKKTNFHFGIPNASGTVVTVNGQHIENLNFESDPQTQINGLKSTNSTQGKDIDDLKNETLKKPASVLAKRKIVGINTSNSQELIDIDEALSETSENPLQNKVVAKGFNNKANKDASNLSDENVESWIDKLGINDKQNYYPFVTKKISFVNGKSSPSTKTKVDLSSYLPTTEDVYEVLLFMQITQSGSDSTYMRMFTDIIGDETNYLISPASTLTSGEVRQGLIWLPIKKDLYYWFSQGASSWTTIAGLGYRRIK